jgi:hypothetical protein
MWQVLFALILFFFGVAVGAALFLRWASRSNENDEDGGDDDTLWFDPLEWIMATKLFRPKPLSLTDGRGKRSGS